MLDDEEKAAICIQSYIRGYLQRRRFQQLKYEPLTYEQAAIIIQKFYRAYYFRKTFQMYKQRLNIQMLCFLQQIELINNDFFTKIVRTNYCVSLKSIETTINSFLNNKQANKLLQHLFPPPPPLPLPMSPSLTRQTDISNSIRIQTNSSSTAAPPLSNSALSFPTRSSSSCHQTILTSPSTVSKFAQVRDIFARGESNKPLKNHQSIPVKSHLISSIDNSKAANVLNAVQEYQRQHINNSQSAYKRFIQVGNNSNSNANRSPNINAIRPRGNSHSGFSNNNNNNNKFQYKQNLPAYTTPSPQQQTKPITRVIKY